MSSALSYSLRFQSLKLAGGKTKTSDRDRWLTHKGDATQRRAAVTSVGSLRYKEAGFPRKEACMM
jgi:hypothetical protein